MTSDQANAISLEKELTWFNKVLETRINSYFQQSSGHDDIHAVEPPPLTGDTSEYARLVQEYGMTFDERIVLMLALVPHIRPQLLDTLFIRNKNFDRGFTEFGGWKGTVHGGFLPTCETAAFILAGSDLAKRFEVAGLFEPDHFFVRKGMIRIDNRANGEPFFSGSLCITTEYLQRFTSGICHKPDFTIHFPAKLITTGLTWDDLVLPPDVLEDIESINTWIRDSRIIMEEWGLKTTIKPGYRSLFYGPPGTGKTLTATLIGAFNDVDVYRIDLSMVVSKFIGETEKNLANVFDQAEHKNWILFFDEADALFGKRTQTSSSNDRYANQEISYLLQRVEDFPGVVILATNLKANIDEAFARRFQSVVYFPMPDSDQRLRLWQGMLGKNPPPMAEDVNLERLADDFELSGGAITNVIRFAAIKALRRSERLITQDDLLKGVGRELMKEGRTMQPS
jgi:hypothetical protein